MRSNRLPAEAPLAKVGRQEIRFKQTPAECHVYSVEVPN